jgi:tetratricopeptide (TPR) repeat protein
MTSRIVDRRPAGRALAALALVVALGTFGGCARSGGRPAGGDTATGAESEASKFLFAVESGANPPTAAADSLNLAHFRELPENERAARRERACRPWRKWIDFLEDAGPQRPAPSEGPTGIAVVWRHSNRGGDEKLAEAMKALNEVVREDPTAVLAWYWLGTISLDVGDLATARHALATAAGLRETEPHGPEAPCRAVADGVRVDDLDLAIARARGWTLRELGHWDTGLAVVTAALVDDPGDAELQLLQGLLLAGAGRCVEACEIASRLPEFEYPWLTMFTSGLSYRPTELAERWIRAMAFLFAGDRELARHTLGEIPFSHLFTLEMMRFWNDVGLVTELATDDPPNLYYGLAHNARLFGGLYPVTPVSLGPVVLDRPDPHDVFYRSYGRFYLAGSRFAHAADLTATCLEEKDPARRELLARSAMAALERCRRWGIWPHHVEALLGRLAYDQGRWDDAERELTAARLGFAAQDTVHGMTNLLLGLVYLQRYDDASARTVLEEAITAEPGNAKAWRSLGVARAMGGDVEGAEAAMDRAVELEPESAIAYYNRGLLAHKCGRLESACEDLRRAVELAPDDPQFVSAYQAATAARRRQQEPQE